MKRVLKWIFGLILVGVLAFGVLNYKALSTIFYVNYLNNFVQTLDLKVEGNTLVIDGIINSKSYDQMVEVFDAYPNIDTLRFMDVPGSLDDEINLQIGRWLAPKSLTSIVGEGGHITSGGPDLFLVGDIRIVEEGAQVGVHSWFDGMKDGSEYAKDDPVHQPYIAYYIEVGLTPQQAEDFYFFTLNAASSEDMYYMKDEELLKYGVATQLID